MDYNTLFGYIGATLTTVAFVPQAVKIIKTKSTKDISLFMYIIFVVGITCWLLYGILTLDYPIIYSNVMSIVLATTILIYKIIYK